MGNEGPVVRHRPAVKLAVHAPELSALGLAELRAYRAALSDEEDKVSYWRRIVQGRVDLLEAQAGSTHVLSLEDLVRVLGDTGTGRSRRALMRIRAPMDLPDLPDLDDLLHIWALTPTTERETDDLIDRLHELEKMLSAYRCALHERIDAATGELILRYREDPLAALDLLPTE